MWHVSTGSGVATLRTSIHLLLTYLLTSHHQVRVAGEGRRVVAPPCPRSTARLQRPPVGRVESFRSWSSQLFRGRRCGRRHVRSGGQLSDTLMWSWRAMFAGVSSSSRATCPNTELRRRDRRWDSEVRPVRWSILHLFGLGRWIGFQAVPSADIEQEALLPADGPRDAPCPAPVPKNQVDSLSRFGRTPTDRQTQTQSHD